jgi:hypothetical protein
MDAPRRVFQLIQLGGDWYWRLDIRNDDGLIGPFMSRDEAEKCCCRACDPNFWESVACRTIWSGLSPLMKALG